MDGEATKDDLTTLRPHIRTCLSCRAALREYRAAPATAAALVPAAVFAASSRPPLLDAPARLLETLAGWSQKAHGAVEMASAQKVAAVAASTVALAGGGAATMKQVERQPERPGSAAKAERASAEAPAPSARAQLAPPTAQAPQPSRPAPPPRNARSRREQRARAAERRTPPAQQEFEPAWAAADPAPAPVTATATNSPAPSATTPAAPESGPSGGGAEEFAP